MYFIAYKSYPWIFWFDPENKILPGRHILFSQTKTLKRLNEFHSYLSNWRVTNENLTLWFLISVWCLHTIPRYLSHYISQDRLHFSGSEQTRSICLSICLTLSIQGWLKLCSVFLGSENHPNREALVWHMVSLTEGKRTWQSP